MNSERYNVAGKKKILKSFIMSCLGELWGGLLACTPRPDVGSDSAKSIKISITACSRMHGAVYQGSIGSAVKIYECSSTHNCILKKVRQHLDLMETLRLEENVLSYAGAWIIDRTNRPLMKRSIRPWKRDCWLINRESDDTPCSGLQGEKLMSHRSNVWRQISEFLSACSKKTGF